MKTTMTIRLAATVAVAAVAGAIFPLRATAAEVVARATSEAFRLDSRDGTRESSGDEVLTWSDQWGNGSKVAILQDGKPIAQGLADEGDYAWSVLTNGLYELTLTDADRTLSERATFRVTGKSDPPSLSNVVAAAHTPWDGKVDLEFSLAGDVMLGLPKGTTPYLVVTARDNATGSNYVASASALSGDTGTTAGVHRVVWDFDAQGLSFSSDSVTFTVSYAYVARGTYCVIDLEGGTSATSYPVTFMEERPGLVWTDEYKTDKLVMRYIEPGTFTMGSTNNTSPGADINFNPQHAVTLTNAFYIGVFETTQRQWEQVMGDRPSFFTNEAHYATRPVEQVSYNMIRGATEGTNWPQSAAVDGTSFLGVLRRKTGLAALDLPTQARWEYACRAGTTTDFNSGKDIAIRWNVDGTNQPDTAMKEVGRYWHNGGMDAFIDAQQGYRQDGTTDEGSAKVGSYEPNAWDLYDMHGNVAEWCLDWAFYDYLANDAVEPVGPVGPGRFRIVRGGRWDSSVAEYCTSWWPGDTYPSGVGSGIGFRLALALNGAGIERTIVSAESQPIAIIPIVPFEAGDIVLADYTGEYDGAGHGIGVTTNAIAGLTLRYALAGATAQHQWGDILPLFTNVCDETVLVEASAPRYFTQTNTATVRIAPRDIAKATIAPIADVVLTGAAAEPAPTVTDGDPSIITADDYDVSYLSNSVPGEAWVVLAGKNNYTGTNAAPFKVVVAELAAEIGWAFLKASGTYFAQLKVTCTNALAAGVDDLRFVFADRIGPDGAVEAALWHTPGRAANPNTETRGGVTYRVVALDASLLAAEGVAATYGVSDLSAATVPAAERAIELYVHRRVAPQAGNEGAAKVGDFVGYVCWTSGGMPYALPVVAGDASRRPVQSMRLLSAPLSAKTLNASLAVGVPLTEDSSPYCRLTAFAVAGDTITGAVEVGAAPQRGTLGANASVTLLGSPSPAGPFAEIATVPVAADGSFALARPEGATFFKLRIDIAEVVR